MIKKCFISLFVILMQFTFAQNFKFGEVSKEELQEKQYKNDSSANAVILYKKQNTYFNSNSGGVKLITEIHKRIKIYNKDGFDNATIILNLYKSRGSKERATKIKAYTYNLIDGKVVRDELDKNQIFNSEYSYNYNQVKFTMPNVKEGSIIEIEYKLSSPFYFNIDEFRFQYDIPVKKLEAEIRTPKGYNFNAKSKGFISFFPNRSSKRDNRLGMEVDILSYSLEDVPALKEENYVNNIDNYKAGVIFELVSIVIPGSVSKYYAKKWGDVAKTIGSSDDYKKELDKTNSFDDSLDKVIANQQNDINKMKSIFKYVKDNIKWNEVDGKYFQYGIRKALKEKKGNAADINLTLVAMLRYAGIDANPLIISTKDNLIPFFPTVDRLNYVLAYAEIDEKRYFLDATDEFSDINIMPLKNYNWKGIFVDNNKLKWKRVGISQPNAGTSLYYLTGKLDEEGKLSGNIKTRLSNHAAYMFRKKFKNQDLDGFLTHKEEILENIEISNYQANNSDTYEGNVTESFDFLKESAADIIDGKIYIQPLLFFKITENPFKLDERAFPIDFGYPFKDSYTINIELPKGYVLESSPEPAVIRLPDNQGIFKFSPTVFENKIQLSVTIEIENTIMDADTYLYLKEFFNQMIIKQKEQIILTKA